MELPELSPLEFVALGRLPPHIEELLLVAIPFLAIAFAAAAVMFLARDLLGRGDSNGGNGRNGNGRNGHGRNGNGRNGNGRNGHARNGNGHGHGNGNGRKKNGNGHYAYGAEMAIPTLAQPTAEEGDDFSSRMENWFSRLLYESGAPFARDVAFMTEVAGGLLVGGILFLWLENIVVAVTGFFFGMGLVIGIYMLASARRKRIMREQLPDVIDHIARAVRAGQTVDQAINLVGGTAPQPLGLEFRRCAGQLNMGLSVDAAMRALSRRIPIPEMRILASTFVVQRRAGGNLPATLERLAKVIRDRITYYRQFRAATAGSRMSMIVVAVTGPLVALYMMIFQPEFFGRFFESTFGWLMFSTAIVFYVLGLTVMYFILKTDY